MTDQDESVPDVTLERYRLGELPKEAMVRLRRRLESDADLRGRLAALEGIDAELSAGDAPRQMAAGVRERLAGAGRSPRPRSTRPWLWPAPMAVAVAVALLLFVLPGRDGGPGFRLKGDDGPSLTLYRATATGSEVLADGAGAGEGDLIRIGYRAGGRTHGLILSVDGRGDVTLHLPVGGTRAAPLEAGGKVLLDHSFELDDAPRREHFYLVTGDEPFELAPVLAAVGRLDSADSRGERLGLPDDLDQVVVTLVKRRGR